MSQDNPYMGIVSDAKSVKDEINRFINYVMNEKNRDLVNAIMEINDIIGSADRLEHVVRDCGIIILCSELEAGAPSRQTQKMDYLDILNKINTFRDTLRDIVHDIIIFGNRDFVDVVTKLKVAQLDVEYLETSATTFARVMSLLNGGE